MESWQCGRSRHWHVRLLKLRRKDEIIVSILHLRLECRHLSCLSGSNERREHHRSCGWLNHSCTTFFWRRNTFALSNLQEDFVDSFNSRLFLCKWRKTETMIRGLFQRKPKHERLKEEPEVRFKGLLVSERDLGYTYVRPGGKNLQTTH